MPAANGRGEKLQSPDAGPYSEPNPSPKAMGDKNPKAKRKLHEQHELQKKQKTEAWQRHQQRLHELHDMKHPHEEPKG
jgi:hypothetical protein